MERKEERKFKTKQQRIIVRALMTILSEGRCEGKVIVGVGQEPRTGHFPSPSCPSLITAHNTFFWCYPESPFLLSTVQQTSKTSVQFKERLRETFQRCRVQLLLLIIFIVNSKILSGHLVACGHKKSKVDGKKLGVFSAYSIDAEQCCVLAG